MNTIIIHKGLFSVLGFQSRIIRGSETAGVFAKIWSGFEQRQTEIESISLNPQYYGISFPSETPAVFDYFAGMIVANDAKIPVGMKKRSVPEGEYAVFECPYSEIGSCYQRIFQEWLPRASVVFAPNRPSFEEYPEKHNIERPVCINIPVTMAGRGVC